MAKTKLTRQAIRSTWESFPSRPLDTQDSDISQTWEKFLDFVATVLWNEMEIKPSYLNLKGRRGGDEATGDLLSSKLNFLTITQLLQHNRDCYKVPQLKIP